MTATGPEPPARRLGLQARLALVSTLVLMAGLGAIGWMLDRSFNAALRTGAEDHLQAVVFGLLSAAQERDGKLAIGDEIGEPRLSRADSGLVAYVDNRLGEIVWRSPSMMRSASRASEQPLLRQRPRPGEFRFDVAEPPGEPPRYVIAYTVVWESLSEELTFWVLAAQAPYLAQLAAFRRSAALGLGLVGLVFIAIQLAAVHWGLHPLRAMADRVRALEAGARSDIGADYPSELSGLARNLNRFIAYEEAARQRYRQAMEDLAHSLKTPLAVLKNAVGESRRRADQDTALLAEQVERMETTVAHQLSRAAAARAAAPTVRVPVMPVATRIVRALQRAYAEKRVAVEFLPTEDSALAARVDERDLMEMLGNLIENAFKYTTKRVRISAQPSANDRLRLTVEDDGPGVPTAQRKTILQRGIRADAATAGHGVGLAVVAELADVYDGSLHIDDSAELGGARFGLELPAA